VRGALLSAFDKVSAKLAWGERLGVVFTGLSLGSILLLVALGLAITYGLMGVINMAHGELMMIGAYATYLVQNAFKAFAPGAFDYYILLAIPASFLAAALVGALLERTVLRWLYGRPLETLLATWGISLVLMQSVRSLFGAQNVPVENPAWLSGGIQAASNLVLPFNRIAIIAFAFLVLGGVALLIAKTRLGLFVRGVTQNRRMAAVRSARWATSGLTWAKATSSTASWWWCWAAWANWPARSMPRWAWVC
jgi:urea transport system permease protein